MVSATRPDEAQIQRTYSQLTFLGFLLHLTQAVIYYKLGFPIPAIYNCISVVFYTLMLYMTRRSMFRVTVSAIHIESSLFALLCVVYCGWGTGVALYLLAMSSLVYFCPFEHKFVPYMFSLGELAIFVALRIYTYFVDPLYGHLPDFAELALYTFNAVACFGIILFAAFSSNISATVTNIRLRSENKNLSAIANSDFLTGLPSRRAFLHRVKALSADTYVIAAMGDLDDFKRINDSFGHSSGDYVLRTVGTLINSSQNEHVIPCRWGGEEFVILFYNCSKADAIAWLQALREQVFAYNFEHEEQLMSVTITFGVYAGVVGDGVERLIDEADKCLYKGKENGKNRVEAL